jgi:hypothetical protein
VVGSAVKRRSYRSVDCPARAFAVSVRRGGELLLDTGHLVIDGQNGTILFSAGPHPIRELLDGSFNITLALPGFCDILR